MRGPTMTTYSMPLIEKRSIITDRRSRRKTAGHMATAPICGMQVDESTPLKVEQEWQKMRDKERASVIVSALVDNRERFLSLVEGFACIVGESILQSSLDERAQANNDRVL